MLAPRGSGCPRPIFGPAARTFQHAGENRRIPRAGLQRVCAEVHDAARDAGKIINRRINRRRRDIENRCVAGQVDPTAVQDTAGAEQGQGPRRNSGRTGKRIGAR